MFTPAPHSSLREPAHWLQPYGVENHVAGSALSRGASRPLSRAVEVDSLTLFAVLWAIAAIFHILVNDRSAPLFAELTSLEVSHILLAICAIWLLLRPTHHLPLLLLAILGPITAWLEAPVLGNHWLLVTFVDFALLLSALTTLRDRKIDRDSLARVFLPLARWCLVLFYCFAGFSKLNSAFFDTAVSCGTYYFDETVHSLGFDLPLTTGADGIARLVPFAVSITELSIPILLLGRRTRVFGVLLGLTFHSLIALDHLHLFLDFSSVLVALFVLFLPDQFASSALELVGGKGGKVLILWMALAGVVLVALWIGPNSVTNVLFLDGRLLIWELFDVTVLIGVVVWFLRGRDRALERPLRLRGKGPIWLAVVPAVLVVNGLLPYLELRTAYGFTMYSNLAMVDGKSNHLLVRSSLPLGNRQANLVRVIASNDPGLESYATYNYLLPWDSFRAYLAKHPDAGVIYQRGGRGYVIYRATDHPELVAAPPVLVQKLLPLRAVDGNDKSRCQDTFLPAL
jgi:hypothetical protein